MKTLKKNAPIGTYIVFNNHTIEPISIEYDYHLGKCPTKINERGDLDPWCYHQCLLVVNPLDGELFLSHLDSSKDFIIRHPHMNIEVNVSSIHTTISNSTYKITLTLNKIHRY